MGKRIAQILLFVPYVLFGALTIAGYAVGSFGLWGVSIIDRQMPDGKMW